MAVEFEEEGLSFGKQVPIVVLYKGKIVGKYFADFVVEGEVVIEIKALVEFSGKEKGQLLNYLRGTDKEVGLVLNFGREAGIKRMILDNGLKG